jgi:prepilin-type processing-associated H-X9-DG protein/prepilin-type N-terminal cleavage/methylation domain-containing protein
MRCRMCCVRHFGRWAGRVPRPGLSLLELLVVLAILGLVVALTLAAVQRTRLTAARASCQNKLRQIALGLHSYHTATGRFPPGVSGEGAKSQYPFLGWQGHLLPHIEQSPLWEETVAAYKQTRDFLSVPPHVGLETPIPVYACPMDARTGSVQLVRGSMRVAMTSYLGVEGTNAFRRDGLLFLDSTTRIADVTDGTSQTLLVGERPPSADLVLGWWYAGWGQDKDGEGDMLLGVRTKNNQSWARSCPIGPYEFTPGKFDNQCDAFHFWSPHSGGANFAFADGSVRFIRYSANDIMPALATRAGGESVAIPD